MKIQNWTTGGKSADVGGKPMQGQAKVRKVMEEFKTGKLKSSSGQKVTNPKQAIAIGLSEAGLSRKKEGGEVKESKAMMKKEVAFMKSKGAPKSMIKHEESEMKGSKKGYMDGGMTGRGMPLASTVLPAMAARRAMGMKKGGTAKKMASGGLSAGHKSADGVAQKGKTKAKQIAMRKGGKC